MESNNFNKKLNPSTKDYLIKNDIYNINNADLNSTYKPSFQMNDDNPSNFFYQNNNSNGNGQQINYNNFINNNFNINNNNIFNSPNHTACIEKSSFIINSNNNSQNIISILDSDKIKIDFSRKENQENIKSILDSLIKCEEKYNQILNPNSKISHKNSSTSPCYIISKTFIDDIKQLFNYDYYKEKNFFNSKIILRQRKNNPKIYINKVKDISIEDFKNNNIAILDENAFLFLYSIDPDIETNEAKHKEHEIYLKNNRGIIIIEENINININYFFIFEINNNDINQIKNYELINFKNITNVFYGIKNELNKNNITDEIWNKIINNYSYNCNFILDRNKDINYNINNLMPKIDKYKNYLQENVGAKQDDIFYDILEEYEKSLFLLEQLLNVKEKCLKNNQKSFFMNNNINNINNNLYNNNFNNMTNSFNSKSKNNNAIINNFENNGLNPLGLSTVVVRDNKNNNNFFNFNNNNFDNNNFNNYNNNNNNFNNFNNINFNNYNNNNFNNNNFNNNFNNNNFNNNNFINDNFNNNINN